MTPQPPRSRLTRMFWFMIPLIAAVSALIPSSEFSGNADLWRKQSIYQVVTDRFAVGGGNTQPCNVTLNQYCGGNWQGIIDKLDYIQSMGFTAIWISPVVKNVPASVTNVTAGVGEAYHGYWPQDLFDVNPHFGATTDLMALSSALHSRGMLLMVDVSPNHMGSGPEPDINYQDYVPWNDESYFHAPNFNITFTPPNQTQIETYWIGAESTVALPDVNTELPHVYSTLYLWIQQLVATYSVDGLRIDTAKHIRKTFWPGFVKAAGVWAVGEVLDGDPTYTGPYQQVIPGILDYVTYYPIITSLTQSGQMNALYNNLATLGQYFLDVTLLGRFIENQDNPRFSGLTNDTGLRQSAFVFNLLGDGIPIVYYGQEDFLTGGNDPENREALWDYGYSGNALITTLNKLRFLAIKQDSTWVTTPANYLYNDNYQLFYQKGTMVVGLNGQSTERNIAPYTVTVQKTPYSSGESLMEVVSCTTLSSGAGSVDVTMQNGAPVVLYPVSSLAGSGICGH